jgi:hypothetical protein
LSGGTRGPRFAVCVRNDGAEDLDVRKVYRVLPDRVAAADGYLRVIDDSTEDYLYPADYFVFVELPQKAKRALRVTQRAAGRKPRAANHALQRIGARGARPAR